jgi:hypothetical protein
VCCLGMLANNILWQQQRLSKFKAKWLSRLTLSLLSKTNAQVAGSNPGGVLVRIILTSHDMVPPLTSRPGNNE